MRQGNRKEPSSAPSRRHLFCALFCISLMFSTAHAAEDEDLRSLELYNGGEVDIVSIDRSPRPASQTAENITVVTTEEIKALNAHTLTDVLYTVAGVQVENPRTPGSFAYLDVQGSRFNHILVLIDNVPINILGENIADVASVPVQMVERIEVVKGAASSSWGSALGGVINIITKSPDPNHSVAGIASASFGSRDTVDARAEVSGTVDRFGYYLTGGKLRSDGLLPNNQVDLDSFYGKLTYDLPVRGSLTLTTGVTSNKTGLLQLDMLVPIPNVPEPDSPDDFDIVPVTAKQDIDNRLLISSLTLRYPLMDRLDLTASLRGRKHDLDIYSRNTLRPGVNHIGTEESAVGGSLILSWLDHLQRIVAGVDYDYIDAEMSQVTDAGEQLEPQVHRVGVYLNDTLTLGAFAITPSIRFDHTGTGENLWSPSFGVTYAVTDNSVLRAYTAKGYSITSINRSDSTEKVWTSQLGFETAEIPYLWVKATGFRNDTKDIQLETSPVRERQVKLGYELELKTTPLWYTSLSLGYTYIDAENEDTERTIEGVGRHTLNLGVKYDDPRYLRALLFGHYIDWNDQGQYKIVWDLHLGKEIKLAPDSSLELFASIRNIFDSDQEFFPYKYPGRWGEVGVRCAF